MPLIRNTRNHGDVMFDPFPVLALALLLAFFLPVNNLLLAGEIADIHLEFDAPAKCASKRAFDDELTTILSHWEGESLAQFNITVTADESPLIVMKVVNGAQTFVRRIRLTDCTHVAKVSALLVAITLDPLALGNISDADVLEVLTNSETEPATDSTGDSNFDLNRASVVDQDAATVAAEEPGRGDSDDNPDEERERSDETSEIPPKTAKEFIRPPNDEMRPSEKKPIQQEASLWLQTTFLALPRWSLGPAVGYALMIGNITFFADARVSFSPNIKVDGDATFRLWQFSPHVGGGYQFRGDKWHLLPVIGISLHFLLGVTSGFERDAVYTQWVAAPFAGLRVKYFLSERYGLFVTGSVHGLTANTRYNADEIGTIHNTGNLLVETGFGFFHFF